MPIYLVITGTKKYVIVPEELGEKYEILVKRLIPEATVVVLPSEQIKKFLKRKRYVTIEVEKLKSPQREVILESPCEIEVKETPREIEIEEKPEEVIEIEEEEVVPIYLNGKTMEVPYKIFKMCFTPTDDIYYKGKYRFVTTNLVAYFIPECRKYLR